MEPYGAFFTSGWMLALTGIIAVVLAVHSAGLIRLRDRRGGSVWGNTLKLLPADVLIAMGMTAPGRAMAGCARTSAGAGWL